MVLGKLPVPGRPTIWIIVGQGPTALAVSAGGGCLDISTLIYPFCPLSLSLWETALYGLKYCLKGPLNPNQPTNTCHGNRSTRSVVSSHFKFERTMAYSVSSQIISEIVLEIHTLQKLDFCRLIIHS